MLFVKNDYSCSVNNVVNFWIPQGSVLGSSIFIIYVNGLRNAHLKCKFTTYTDYTALCYFGKS